MTNLPPLTEQERQQVLDFAWAYGGTKLATLVKRLCDEHERQQREIEQLTIFSQASVAAGADLMRKLAEQQERVKALEAVVMAAQAVVSEIGIGSNRVGQELYAALARLDKEAVGEGDNSNKGELKCQD